VELVQPRLEDSVLHHQRVGAEVGPDSGDHREDVLAMALAQSLSGPFVVETFEGYAKALIQYREFIGGEHAVDKDPLGGALKLVDSAEYLGAGGLPCGRDRDEQREGDHQRERAGSAQSKRAPEEAAGGPSGEAAALRSHVSLHARPDRTRVGCG
jgi:hypothetical protein